MSKPRRSRTHPRHPPMRFPTRISMAIVGISWWQLHTKKIHMDPAVNAPRTVERRQIHICTLHIYKVGVQQANLLDEKANPYFMFYALWFLTYTYSRRKWEKQSAQRIIIACRYLNREICSMQYGAVTIFMNIHLRCIFLAFYEFHLAMPSPSDTVGDECIQQLEPSSPAVTLCDALQQHEIWKRSGGLSPSSNTKISSCFDSSSLMAWTKTSSLWCHIGLRVSKEEREYLVFFVVEIFQRCRYVNHMSLIELVNHFMFCMFLIIRDACDHSTCILNRIRN